MSGRVQMQVLKEGTYNENDWSTRTLTIDPPTCTAIVSRHNHPDDVLHHAMHVLAIQKASDAPTHHHRHHSSDKEHPEHHHGDSAEAKLTVHLIGKKVPVPKLSEQRPPEEGQEGQQSGAAGAEDATPYSNSSSPAERVNPAEGGSNSAEHTSPANGGDENVDDSWMIRCTSQESYDTVVRTLEEMLHAHRHERHALKDPNPRLPAMPPPVVGATMHNLTQGPIL